MALLFVDGLTPGHEYCLLQTFTLNPCPELSPETDPEERGCFGHVCCLDKGHEGDEHVCACGKKWVFAVMFEWKYRELGVEKDVKFRHIYPREERYLRLCNECGCQGSGRCGRMVDTRDGSILPERDTGFRYSMEVVN